MELRNTVWIESGQRVGRLNALLLFASHYKTLYGLVLRFGSQDPVVVNRPVTFSYIHIYDRPHAGVSLPTTWTRTKSCLFQISPKPRGEQTRASSCSSVSISDGKKEEASRWASITFKHSEHKIRTRSCHVYMRMTRKAGWVSDVQRCSLMVREAELVPLFSHHMF